MISAVAVSAGIVSAASLSCSAQRKSDLLALGVWGLTTGRWWLVRAVHAAIEQEALCDV
jgi:hypothetical protein